jgi:hypothetical protein
LKSHKGCGTCGVPPFANTEIHPAKSAGWRRGGVPRVTASAVSVGASEAKSLCHPATKTQVQTTNLGQPPCYFDL